MTWRPEWRTTDSKLLPVRTRTDREVQLSTSVSDFTWAWTHTAVFDVKVSIAQNRAVLSISPNLLCPRPLGGHIKRCFCLICLSDVCLSRTSEIHSRTERPRKTKIATQVAHVTRDSDTTFKVKKSKVNLKGRGNIVAESRTSSVFIKSLIFMAPTAIGSKARWAPQA